VPTEGIARLRETGARSLEAFLRLLHRPIWLFLIVAAAAAIYQYMIHPLMYDPDLERLDAPAMSAAPPQTAQPPSAASVSSSIEQKKPAQPAASKQPATSPLVVTITVDEEKEASSIRRINDAMKEHALLRTMRFGRSAREISGSLTTGELRAFFGRIDGAGKVSYRRSRLASAGEGELIPFVMRLVIVSAPPPPAPPSAPAAVPEQRPAVQKPAVQKPAETPAETPAPQPESEVAPTAPQGQ
jgi:hypothetical protein